MTNYLSKYLSAILIIVVKVLHLNMLIINFQNFTTELPRLFLENEIIYTSRFSG